MKNNSSRICWFFENYRKNVIELVWSKQEDFFVKIKYNFNKSLYSFCYSCIPFQFDYIISHTVCPRFFSTQCIFLLLDSTGSCVYTTSIYQIISDFYIWTAQIQQQQTRGLNGWNSVSHCDWKLFKTHEHIYILISACAYIVFGDTNIFNLQSYKNNCVLFSAFGFGNVNAQNFDSKKISSLTSVCWCCCYCCFCHYLLLLLLVLSSKNYKWMYGNEKHQHISFHFICMRVIRVK